MTTPRSRVGDSGVSSGEKASGRVSDSQPVVRRSDERRPDETGRDKGVFEMTRYLISFPNGAMAHIPDEDVPDVSKAAHAVISEAKDAGVFVFAGGLDEDVKSVVVATDGAVTDGPYPETKEVIGGLTVVDVPSREEALEWAAKIAVSCRCAQEVREFMFDPLA
jgi:hypothetical protein